MQLLDHVSITVHDLDAARPFYDAVMRALGADKVYDRPDALGYGERCGPGNSRHSYLSVFATGAGVDAAMAGIDGDDEFRRPRCLVVRRDRGCGHRGGRLPLLVLHQFREFCLGGDFGIKHETERGAVFTLPRFGNRHLHRFFRRQNDTGAVLPHAAEAYIRKEACRLEVGCGKGKIDRREIHDDARRRIEVMNIELRLLGKIENDARSCLVADDARLLGDKRPGGMGCGDDGDMGRDGKCKGACKPRDSRANPPCPT